MLTFMHKWYLLSLKFSLKYYLAYSKIEEREEEGQRETACELILMSYTKLTCVLLEIAAWALFSIEILHRETSYGSFRKWWIYLSFPQLISTHKAVTGVELILRTSFMVKCSVQQRNISNGGALRQR